MTAVSRMLTVLHHCRLHLKLLYALDLLCFAYLSFQGPEQLSTQYDELHMHLTTMCGIL